MLGNSGSYQGAVSVYWNTPGLPGQCGTCWQLNNGTKLDGNRTAAGPIGTEPIVVMIDNTCGADPSKPTGGHNGFQCNQNAANPTDGFGSVTVVDLCADTGASDAFFGSSGAASPGEDGHRAGLALATITQVDCGKYWKGSVNHFEKWTKFQAICAVRAKDVVVQIQMQITRTSCQIPVQRDESFSECMMLIVIIAYPVPITSSRLSKDQPIQTCITVEGVLLIA